MSGEIDAVGTAVEGALLGAAVEHEKSGDSAQKDGGGDCLNCGAQLSGHFCSNCGQKAHIHRSLAAIWHDIAHGVLHFDGKLWRTLPMLAFKPGQLTRRYIEGQRASYISPMALFLFSIFLMFAIFSFTGGSAAPPASNNAFSGALAQEIAEVEADIKKLELAVKDGSENSQERREDLAGLKRAANGLANIQGKELPYPKAGFDSGDGGILESDGEIGTGVKWLDEKLTTGAKKANSNPSLLLYKLQSNGYKFAWLLIPLSLPFVWLVTIGAGGSLRGHHFYDHAIFTTYSISFMSLLFLVCALLSKLGWSWPWLALVIIPPMHLYKQLKNTYQLGRLGTLMRLSLMLVSIVVILTLFFLILLFLGILG